MAVMIKCKMCGGDLVLVDGKSVAECEYCGTVQTVPSADSEKKLTLFARANRLRSACEFDKAAGIYEAIVADFPQEAEAYWGLVLCKYGIEYVDDPATGKKVPTCHRSSFDSVLDDGNYDQALENADSTARKVYREEARQLEEIRTGIIAVSANEEPYDIFICYKETADGTKERTLDSVLAQDIYDALTEKGYRTFFARITLEDKLGMEYEPYIFAALNSAKIMLVVGTDYDHFNAVWVKNEWSRFLKLMAGDKSKYLIPVFKGIDAYDMPREFAKLQAQDWGKVGAMQDLLRGIEKILPKKQPVVQTVVQTVQSSDTNTVSLDVLLSRAHEYLQKGDWYRATQFADKTLDFNPNNAEAYLIRLMSKLKIRSKDEFDQVATDFSSDLNYKQYLRYCTPIRKAEIEKYAKEATMRTRYQEALTLGESKEMYKVDQGIRIFSEMLDWQDSRKQHQRLLDKKKSLIYDQAWKFQFQNNPDSWKKAISLYESIEDWKDAVQQKRKCREKLQQIDYQKAMELKDKPMVEEGWNYTRSDLYKETGKYPWELKADEYMQAKDLFDAIPGYKDAAQQSEQCVALRNTLLLDKAKSNIARKNEEDIYSAITILRKLNGIGESAALLESAKNGLKVEFLNNIRDGERVKRFVGRNFIRCLIMLAFMVLGFFMAYKYETFMDLIPKLEGHPGLTQAIGAALLLSPFHKYVAEFFSDIIDFLEDLTDSYKMIGHYFVEYFALRNMFLGVPVLTLLFALLWGVLNFLENNLWGLFGLVGLLMKVSNFLFMAAGVIGVFVAIFRVIANKNEYGETEKKVALYHCALHHLDQGELDKLEKFCGVHHLHEDKLKDLLAEES